MVRYILIALLLLGCNSQDRFETAKETKPPSGWVDYCKRNSQDIHCKE